MKKISIFSVFVIVIIILSFQSFSFAASSNSNATKRGENVMENKPEVWLTTADQNFLLTKVNLETYVYKDLPARRVSVEIDPTKKFQQMDGFGASLTDSSAHLIFNVLTKSQREELMKKLFSYENGIGISFLRQPMGSSDFALSMYSYDDLPQGVTEDYDLKYFSIEHDKKIHHSTFERSVEYKPILKDHGLTMERTSLDEDIGQYDRWFTEDILLRCLRTIFSKIHRGIQGRRYSHLCNNRSE